MKEIASDSEQSTRDILSIGIGEMNPCTINKLLKLESVKRTIRNYKSISVWLFVLLFSGARVR